MIEITDFEEITQIKLSREINGQSLFWVSAYLVDDILIDSGCVHTAEELLGFLSDKKISRVINTHYHEDHVGANRLLEHRRNVLTFAHESSLEFIKKPPKVPHYREKVWGSPEGSNAVVCPDVIETDRFLFEVVETPGHCPGHISLVEKRRGWVFSGDLFIGNNLAVAGPENNLTDMLSSMKTLLSTTNSELTLLTSLRTIRRDGRKTLSQFVRKYENLSCKAKELGAQGMETKQIVVELFGGESVFDAITGGEYSSANLVKLLLEAEICC